MKILFYGSYIESDLVMIVVVGVKWFEEEKLDFIIVDMLGRYK